MRLACALREYVCIWVLHVLLISLATLSYHRISAADHRTKCNHIPAIFNFGDSNSDTGEVAAAFGAPPLPNGETFFHRPSGRNCDGRLLIDFVAEELGLPYLDAYLQSVGSNFKRGANFAAAAATIQEQSITLQQLGFSPFTLGVQVTQFTEFKQRALTYHLQEPFSFLLPDPDYFNNGMYVLDIGQNDLTAGFFFNLTLQQVEDSIPKVVHEVRGHLKALHGQGAKKFMIVTTGPVGCLPYILTRLPRTPAEIDEHGCAEPYNRIARIFNKELRANVDNLQQQLRNTTFVVVDGYNLKYDLFVKAHKEGFKFTERACCGYGGGHYNFNSSIGYCGSTPKNQSLLNLCPDPSEYIVWDGIHYTEAANHVVAEGLFSGKFSTPTFPSGHFCDLFT